MTERRTEILGRALCIGGASLGALVLLGWLEGMEFLITVVPGRPRMPPDAAFALLLLGIAGALLHPNRPAHMRRLFAWLIGSIVIAIGVEIAVTYAIGIQLPLDQFFSPNHAAPYPWRRSPPTAIALVSLGAAILIFDYRHDKHFRPSEWLILCASLIAITALLGCLYGAGAHYRVSGVSNAGLAVPVAAMKALRFSGKLLMFGVSVPGAMGALMIGVGLLLERPDSGVMRVFALPGPGGELLKHLMPAAIVIPVVLGFLAARLPGGEDVPLAFAALTAITVLASVLLLAITAAHLNRAEEALHLSEAKFSGMVSTSADAIISIDELQRITLFNAGAEKIFGYSSGELIGASFDVLIPERFRESHAQRVRSFRAGPDGARQANARETISGLRRNGEEFPADASISKLSVGGKCILSVTLRDMTESKRLYEAAIHATQARDEMLGIVAHDLRNPLQIISINADCLRRGGPEPVSEMAAEIGDAAKRMNRLIQDLLDVTSMESGHLSLNPERLYAAEIFSELLDLQTALTNSASLKLRVTIAPDLPDVWADHDRILRVFENLIGNAIKFTKPGGSVTLRADASRGEVVFSVSDTGSGILDTDLPHVFDRFWQASHGSHRGAGLGLHIVKGIVEAHGGRIWVRSTAGHGTTFFFTIPTVAEARQRPEARVPRINAVYTAKRGDGGKHRNRQIFPAKIRSGPLSPHP